MIKPVLKVFTFYEKKNQQISCIIVRTPEVDIHQLNNKI